MDEISALKKLAGITGNKSSYNDKQLIPNNPNTLVMPVGFRGRKKK